MPRRIAISVADQALLSLLNFLVGIWLIRATGKDQYGLYLAGTSALLYIVGIQNALFTTQMTVLAPLHAGNGRESFCAALVRGQLLLFALPALLVTAGAFAVATARDGTMDGSLLVGTVAAVSLGVLAREFYRGYFFQKQSPQAVLAMDLAFGALWLGGVVGASRLLPERLNLITLATAGVASLLVGLAAARVARLPVASGLNPATAALSEAWQGGRWALAGMTVTWLQDQSYIYLLGTVAGAAATAEAGAARLLLVPGTLILVGVFRVLMPRWAHLRQSGEESRVRLLVRRTALLAAGTIVVYALLVAAVRESALAMLFPKAYGDIGHLVMLWGVLCALQAARSAYSTGLQVFQRFREITLANSASAVIVVVLGIALAGRFGAAGGIMAQIVGELSLMLLLGRAVGHAV